MHIEYNCCFCGKHQKSSFVTLAYAKYVARKPKWYNECDKIVEKWKKLNKK